MLKKFFGKKDNKKTTEMKPFSGPIGVPNGIVKVKVNAKP